MSQSVITLMHMLIGVGGAGLAIYGSGKMCDVKYMQAKYDACAKGAVPKGSTKAKVEQACKAKYKAPNAMFAKVLMYGGPGIIVVIFAVMALMNSQMFGGGGYGGQYGGQF